MDKERRKFLQHVAAVCGTGVARSLGATLGAGAIATAGTAAAVAAAPAVATVAGTVREQVLAVIARQAVVGYPWKEICAGPMQVNRITLDDVEAEIRRYENMQCRSTSYCQCAKCLRLRRDIDVEVNRKLRELPHSTESPCACSKCMSAMIDMRGKVRQDVINSFKDCPPGYYHIDLG